MGSPRLLLKAVGRYAFTFRTMIGQNGIIKRPRVDHRVGGPTARDIGRLTFALRPSARQAGQMVADICKKVGVTRAAIHMGVAQEQVNEWQKDRPQGPPISKVARRGIWTVWALHFHPSSLANMMDFATWGRFAKNPPTCGLSRWHKRP